jgi:hypothetical protein
LFRWLSKKYPKIGEFKPRTAATSFICLRSRCHAVERVIEDKPEKVTGPDGKETYEEINYGGPNPNGFEVDNLYCQCSRVDMPCADGLADRLCSS